MRRIIPKQWVNVSFEEFMFSDFDNDKVKNIDDFRPFNKKVSKFPSIKKNKQFYHRPQFGGGDVKLSDELLAIQKHATKFTPYTKNFIQGHKRAEGRIKTIPSIMGKLRKRYINDLTDISGIRILTKNRAEADKIKSVIIKKYPSNPLHYDNYYKNPKNHYRAYHIELVDTKNMLPIELQIKSRALQKLHERWHEKYKKGKKLSKEDIKEAERLYKEGY